MKILLVTHFFPPNHPGGTEAYTFGLARTLKKMGHEPYVVCAEDWGSGEAWQPRHEESTFEGIPVRRLYWNWQHAPHPGVNFYDNPEVDRHLAVYLRERRPDVVHISSCYTLGAGIIREARAAAIPTFLTLTDFWFLCPRHTLQRGDGSLCEGPRSSVECLMCLGTDRRAFQVASRAIPANLVARGMLKVARVQQVQRLSPFRSWTIDAMARLKHLRRAFDDVDVVVSPSQFLIDVFVANGFSVEKFRLSRHGLDASSWLSQLRTRDPDEADRNLRIGYLGQISEIKGVDLLVRAFQSIASAVSAELLIYGDLTKDASFSDKLRNLAAGCDRIRFMGQFERSQIADVLSELDVVVVPSIWYENAPVVIAEAFAAGKPVIATDLGGMREAVQHGVNGLTFPRGDVPALARVIHAVASDQALREKLRQGIPPIRTIEEEAMDLVRLYETTTARNLPSLSEEILR